MGVRAEGTSMTKLFERILFATDLSPASGMVLESLAEMKGLGLKAVRLLYVVESEGMEGSSEDMYPQARREMVEVEGRLARLGIEVDSSVMQGRPADVIVEAASSWGATLILMGHAVRGPVGRLLVGDIALDVMHLTRTPVLAEAWHGKAARRPPLERLLVPVDFSDAAEVLLDRLRELAGSGLGGVVLVHVVEDTGSRGYVEEQVKSAESLLGDVAAALNGAGVKTSLHVHAGRAVNEILEVAAEEDVTAIVLGSYRKGFIRDALGGDVAGRVLSHSPVSVLYFPLGEVSG